MTLRLALGIAIASALALRASPAAAQTDFKAAQEHYNAAIADMDRGDYAGAALEFGIAYDITKDPILFFKIGTANEKAGKCNVALTYYNRYLKEGNPSEEYRKLTEERVEFCKGQTGEGGTGTGTGTGSGSGTGSGTGTGSGEGGDLGGGLGPSFTEHGTSWKRSAAWISTGATVGLVAVGAVLYMSGQGSEDDINALIDFRDPSGRPAKFVEVKTQYDNLVDDGKRFDRLSTIAFVSAGVCAAAAVTFFVLDHKDVRHEHDPGLVGLVPQIDGHGARVVLGWTF